MLWGCNTQLKTFPGCPSPSARCLLPLHFYLNSKDVLIVQDVHGLMKTRVRSICYQGAQSESSQIVTHKKQVTKLLNQSNQHYQSVKVLVER